MIILILVGVGFWNLAKAKGLTPFVWALIACGAYFGAQFIAGMIIGLTSPSLLNNTGALLGISLVSGLAGVLLVWIGMMQVVKNKAKEKDEGTGDVLDDEYLEKL